MAAALAFRVLHAAALLFLLSLLVFSLSRAVPGDIWTELETNPSISPATLSELRASYGMDKPVLAQYFVWLGQMLRGNLGYSPVERRAIAPLLWQRLGRTIALASATTAITLLATLFLSFLILKGNWHQRWLDSTLIPLLLAFPTALVCLLMNWIRIEVVPPVHDYPIGGGSTLERLLWPSLSLAIPLTAFLSKQMRREIDQILAMPYSVISRAKGLPSLWLFRDVLKPAVPVFLNLAGFLFASLMGGAILAETVFDFPGIGLLTWNAMVNRDTLLLTAGVLAGCSAVILVNLIVDLLAIWADPRLRKPSA
ncbi:MAG: ABC transporter permease [Acidobacteria bacterium]|nr:ABC transporter permease [Acidobacteriota bacterium]